MEIPKDEENGLQDYSITMMQLYKIAQVNYKAVSYISQIQISVEPIH